MDTKDFILIAHRGFSSKAPENTLAAFRLAIEAGFPHIELDIQLTSDSIPIVIHDDTVDRTTNGSGKISDQSLEDIRRLDAGLWFAQEYAGEQIPILRDVLSEIAGTAHLHIELKSREKELAPLIAVEINKAKLKHSKDLFAMPGITITSFEVEQLERSLKLLPNIAHSWLVPAITDKNITKARQLGIRQLCPMASEASIKRVKNALNNGLSVRGWGVNSERDIINIYQSGAEGTTVNWPDKAAKLLKQINR